MPAENANPDLPTILIAGDVYADWLLFEKEATTVFEQKTPAEERRAWKNEKQVFIPAVHGGAWIVERFIRMALAPQFCKYIHTYKRFTHHALRSGDSRYVIHQLTSLKHYPLREDQPKGKKVYRAIPGSHRFTGPERDEDQIHPFLLPGSLQESPGSLQETIVEQCDAIYHDCGSKPEDVTGKSQKERKGYYDHIKRAFSNSRFFPADSKRRILVLYDRGDGFADHKQVFLQDDKTSGRVHIKKDSRFSWQYLFLKRTRTTGCSCKYRYDEDFDSIEHIILSVKNLPIPESEHAKERLKHPILDYLTENKLLDRTTIVLDANDLRAKGSHITRGASWERTAEDTLKLFSTSCFLSSLKDAHKIVIRFGVSGAIVRVQGNGLDRTSLVFDPTCNEQGYGDLSKLGVMYPMDAVVVASLASQLFLRSVGLPKVKSNIVDDCLNSVSIALATCRTYFDRGVNPKILSRESIENWDSDFSAGVYDEGKPCREKRATVLGTYSSDKWIGEKAELKWDVYINDEYAFGKIFTDPDLALLVCKMVATETFEVRSLAILQKLNAGLPNDKRAAIEFKVREYEGRSSRVLASLDIDLSRTGDAEKQLLCEQIKNCKEFSRAHGYDMPAGTANEQVAYSVKWLVMNVHEAVSQSHHHRMFSPFSFFHSRELSFSPYKLSSPMPDKWVVLPTGNEKLIEIARKIVRLGFDKTKTHDEGVIPYAKFGEMTIVDRQEIETFRSLNLLIRNYLDRSNPDRPLCAAVFGPPGSGKSFGVKQLALSCGIRSEDMLEFNLSQFESRLELERALINVRNACSPSRTPLVFFDEFDSTHGSNALGWLKMFLSVMQDGTFAFGGDLMRLGKSILVFAGGTSHSFAQFSGMGANQDSFDHKYFRSVKGPDFVSRLRGHIDIAGVNPVDVLQGGEGFHYLRRAAMIRSTICREYSDLLDRQGVVQIDPGVLDALIRVSRYTHGARSLAALFDMSNLVGRRKFEKSYLPSAQQLAMHLESTESHDGVKEFFELLDSPTRSNSP